MPEMSGFTLTERIRDEAALDSTVIMMLTSGDRPEDISHCEDLNIAAYLMKPIKQSELLEAVMLAMGITVAEDYHEAAASQRRHGELRPLRILLAEDSLVNQKLAVALLESAGTR